MTLKALIYAEINKIEEDNLDELYQFVKQLANAKSTAFIKKQMSSITVQGDRQTAITLLIKRVQFRLMTILQPPLIGYIYQLREKTPQEFEQLLERSNLTVLIDG